MYCKTCWYNLSHLSEHRCPECGKPFDPNNPRSYSPRPHEYRLDKIARWLAHPVALMIYPWLCILHPIAALLFPLVLITSVSGSLFQRRFGGAMLVFLLSPLSLPFLFGVSDYFKGKARLQTMGLPSLRFFSVDRTYRCEWVTGGCLVNGTQWIHEIPNNFAVKTCIRLLGPQKGSYVGPYPTEEGASIAALNGITVTASELLSDKLSISGVTILLDKGVGSALLTDTDWAWALGNPREEQRMAESYGPITGAIISDSCLVLRIPSASHWNGKPSGYVVVIDTNRGRPFAFYPEPEFHARFPRVTWNKR